MKTAIYIEDGTVQLVLTPENEFEKNALRSFEDKPMESKIFIGAFYDCRGGWVRQKAFYGNAFGETNEDRSLIIRTLNKQPEPSPKQPGSENHVHHHL